MHVLTRACVCVCMCVFVSVFIHVCLCVHVSVSAWRLLCHRELFILQLCIDFSWASEFSDDTSSIYMYTFMCIFPCVCVCVCVNIPGWKEICHKDAVIKQRSLDFFFFFSCKAATTKQQQHYSCVDWSVKFRYLEEKMCFVILALIALFDPNK